MYCLQPSPKQYPYEGSLILGRIKVPCESNNENTRGRNYCATVPLNYDSIHRCTVMCNPTVLYCSLHTHVHIYIGIILIVLIYQGSACRYIQSSQVKNAYSRAAYLQLYNRCSNNLCWAMYKQLSITSLCWNLQIFYINKSRGQLNFTLFEYKKASNKS